MMTPEEDAAYFRVRLDEFFHAAPIHADGTIKVDDSLRVTIDELSRHTYRDGKRGVMEARKTLLPK